MQMPLRHRLPLFISLRVKLLLGFTLLFTVLYSGAFYWFYQIASQRATDRLAEDLTVLITGAAQKINGDDLRGLYQTGEKNAQGLSDDPRYLHEADWLDLLKIIDPRMTAYTMVQVKAPDQYAMITVAAARADPTAARFKDALVVNPAPPEFLELFSGDRKTWLLLRPYQDQWGRWISGYIAIPDSQGQVAGVLGADFRADYLYAMQRQLIAAALPTFIVTYLLLFAAVFVISMLLSRPISALRVKADRIGEGDYNQDFTGLTGAFFRDEINDLAAVFQLMTGKVRVAIQQLRQEVAERQRIEAALRDSEARYRTLVETSPDAIALTDIDGKFVMANPQAVALLGYASEVELIGQSSLDYFAPYDRGRARVNMQETVEVGHFRNGEYAFQKKDGTTFFGELNVSLVTDFRRQPYAFISILRDISERKRAEEAVRRRQATRELLFRAQQAFNSSLDLDQVLATVLEEVRLWLAAIVCSIWLTDPETGELVCRQATGPRQDLLRGWRLPVGVGVVSWVVAHNEGVNLSDVLTDQRYYAGIDQKTQVSLRSLMAVPLSSREGAIGVLEARDTAVGRFQADDLALLEGLGLAAVSAIENARLYEKAQQEIAQRKSAEEAASAANASLRALSQRLVEVQERERRQLALELHDELGQLLNSAKLSLDMMACPADAELLERTQKILSELIERVRQMAVDLRPALLDDFGLTQALNSLFKRHYAQLGLRVDFQNTVPETRRFPSSIEIAAYRIVQEGLINVSRHAGVKEVKVVLSADEANLNLDVIDEGAGFVPEEVLSTPTSTGVSGMRERARLLGGQLVIESAPGAGTRLKASLPLTVSEPLPLN